MDRMDDAHLLTCEDVTWANQLDVPERALKVATRVRIPLGLPFLICAGAIHDGCPDLPDDDKEWVELGDPSGAQQLPSSG
jgi:hypothetical protein